jgi:heme exporter protein D
MNVVAMLSTELSLPADGMQRHTDVCNMGAGDLVVTFWLLGFGMLLPLYVLYVNELIRKQLFLKQGIQQQAADPQQQPAVMNTALQLGWLVHVAAVILLLTLALAAAEALLSLTGPVRCTASCPAVELGWQHECHHNPS